MVWALDRITREGAEGALRIIRQFKQRGCTVVSVTESWLNAAPEVQDVVVAFAGWMAQQESRRRSERIRAGLARRRAEDKPVSRQPGAADRKPRKRSGCSVLGRRQAPRRTRRQGGVVTAAVSSARLGSLTPLAVRLLLKLNPAAAGRCQLRPVRDSGTWRRWPAGNMPSGPGSGAMTFVAHAGPSSAGSLTCGYCPASNAP